MDSLSSVSPSIVLPPANPLPTQRQHRPQVAVFPFAPNTHLPRFSSFFRMNSSKGRLSRVVDCKCKFNGGDMRAGGGGEDDDGEKEEVERALNLDGTIPSTSSEFLKRVSSRAYDMRRHLQQTFDSSSYDVLEANPWRDPSKAVYVLTHKENQLCTMKTRRNRSEVETELGLLFSKGAKRSSGRGNKTEQPRSGTKFEMLVEDVREGVLVFEDENEAAKYCDLMQGGCEGVAEIEASSVFDLCRTVRVLVVLFRRGRTPPLPQSLELNLKARKRSLEDQEGFK
ncbi:hypothetical protein F3Y22_tig00112742pilonHSYRG00060 [Hibiscus syriacus]|uniref:Uncharacterized protein n=1 Tax=Hibiscus syriacus TaxID=106335 RepID=A0A6A2XBE1_HIBSY|nr:uncharacterized protein LOC120183269 [Hibiscus syriacus]KAE8664635.1 hypothetical protein F3Y22_tig00112742pilonHSYRG00060 [Hibiscus syriacus]